MSIIFHSLFLIDEERMKPLGITPNLTSVLLYCNTKAPLRIHHSTFFQTCRNFLSDTLKTRVPPGTDVTFIILTSK